MNVIDALALARELHAGQVDKAGEPYIWHPVRVMVRLPVGASQDAKIVALLHDVIEDCGATVGSLIERKVPSRIARGVLAVSRQAGEPYRDFIRSIASLGGVAAQVKLADIEDNLDAARMNVLTALDPLKAASLRQKYRDALNILTEL